MGKNLIIVDMQNDFITGALGTPEAIEAERYIVKDLNFNSFDRIFLTRDTHFDWYGETAEGKKLPIPHCIRYSKGWELSEAIMEKVVKSHVPYYFCDKYTFGYNWNNVNGVLGLGDEYTIVGVCTDICVISNALMLKALHPENVIQVIGYMCAGTTPEMHDKAIDVMASCQIDIV